MVKESKLGNWCLHQFLLCSFWRNSYFLFTTSGQNVCNFWNLNLKSWQWNSAWLSNNVARGSNRVLLSSSMDCVSSGYWQYNKIVRSIFLEWRFGFKKVEGEASFSTSKRQVYSYRNHFIFRLRKLLFCKMD